MLLLEFHSKIWKIIQENFWDGKLSGTAIKKRVKDEEEVKEEEHFIIFKVQNYFNKMLIVFSNKQCQTFN